MKIEGAIGFRHVLDLLSSENKLIVGHNCFLGMHNLHFWGDILLIKYVA